MSETSQMPEEYIFCEIAEIDHASYEHGKAVVWFTSTQGQKVALVAPLDDLSRAMLHIRKGALGMMPGAVILTAVNGGKAA